MKSRMHTLRCDRTCYMVLAAVMVVVSTFPASAEQYSLSPTPGFGTLLEPGIKVIVNAPKGWRGRAATGRSVGFVLKSSTARFPEAQLQVRPLALGELNFPAQAHKRPANSFSVVNLKMAGNVTSIEKMESFRTRQYGTLPIWRIRSTAYDLFLVLIVQKTVVVDVTLSGENSEDVVKYLQSLKDLVRSIEIVHKER